MAITFVAGARTPTSFPAVSSNTSSCSITKPTGTTTDDVMVVCLASGLDGTYTYPSGWVEVANYQRDASSQTSGLAYKVVTSGDSGTSSYNFTVDTTGTPMCGQILTYRGVDTASVINASGNSGTAGTDTVACPTVVSSATGTYVWFRFGKTSEVLTEGNYAITNGTSRIKTSNRGGSTQYWIESADSNGDVAAGSLVGATYNCSASTVQTGSIERTVVLKTLGTPATGTITSSTPSITSTFAGTRTIPAGSITGQTPSLSATFAGVATPPQGTITSSVPSITSTFAGSGIGGGVNSTLPSLTSSLVGGTSTGSVSSTLPLVSTVLTGGTIGGTLSALLPSLTTAIVAETIPFGEHVIRPEPEHRAFRVTDDGTGLVDIKRSQVTQP